MKDTKMIKRYQFKNVAVVPTSVEYEPRDDGNVVFFSDHVAALAQERQTATDWRVRAEMAEAALKRPKPAPSWSWLRDEQIANTRPVDPHDDAQPGDYRAARFLDRMGAEIQALRRRVEWLERSANPASAAAESGPTVAGPTAPPG